MSVILITVAVAALATFAVWIVKKRKAKKHRLAVKKGAMPFPQFQQKMMAAGFAIQETAFLYEVIASANIEYTAAFLGSPKSLDAVIKLVMQKLAANGKDRQPASQVLLGKLLDRRKRMAFQKRSMRKPLFSSREIPAGQRVQVVFAETGIFTTQVLAHSSCFSIFAPVTFGLPADFKWKGRKAMLFFRNANDGEYSFATTVVKEAEDEKTGAFVLLLNHQEPLSRTQKRKSIRVPLKKQAHIYPADISMNTSFVEGTPCALSDISDDGCSVILSGNPDMPHLVIVQFTLGGQLITINGECQIVQYNETKNVSTLHIKADSIPRGTKNIILSVMFGIISEQNDMVVISGTRKEGAPRQAGEPPPEENRQEGEVAATFATGDTPPPA